MLEATAASDWYAKHAANAGEAFRIALDETVERIAELPGVGHQFPGEPSVRRVHLRGFPFWVLYEEAAGELIVLAVAHEKRKPDYWREP